MKSNLFLTVLCLLLFAAIGQTQEIHFSFNSADTFFIKQDDGSFREVSKEELSAMGVVFQMNSATPQQPLFEQVQQAEQPETSGWNDEFVYDTPVTQQIMKANTKAILRSSWNGADVITAMAFDDPTIHAALGTSEEQYQQYIAHIENGQNSPEALKMLAEMDALENTDDFRKGNVDEETQKKLQDLAEQLGVFISKLATDAMNNVLTPEQKQKIQEIQLANMAEMQIISPSIFEALNLADAQKQQMETIKKKLEPEFEKTIDILADGEVALQIKVWDKYRSEGIRYSPEMNEPIKKKLMEENPEYKKIYEEIQSKGQAFSTKFKTQMFDVLTDEQWMRLQELIDNPPEHALIFRKRLRENAGESEESKEGEKPGTWIPGPGAWQPGSSAIPEQYRQERNSRRPFPRGSNPHPDPL